MTTKSHKQIITKDKNDTLKFMTKKKEGKNMIEINLIEKKFVDKKR